jgi:hypothetical protein
MTAKKLVDRQFWWIGLALLAFTAGGGLIACGGGGDADADTKAQQTFIVRVTNLTANQPFSPAALVFHRPTLSLWEAGDTASDALELLAESGDPQPLVDGVAGEAAAVAAMTGSGVIPPGGSEAFTATLSRDNALAFTLATMLVNTNDAFAGASGVALPALEVGQHHTWYLPAYDAGTEANSETAATIPGPAAGGEGFAVARDDVDRIAVHSGVISAQDDLVASALDGSHRWDNPVLRLEFIRTD